MRPHPGYDRKDMAGNVIGSRLPDIDIFERAGQPFVRGCRCIQGDYRGISLSDKQLQFKGMWHHYLVPKCTPIPPGLMVTRDSINHRTGIRPYTLGPKDDMPLALFLATLKSVADVAVLNN